MTLLNLDHDRDRDRNRKDAGQGPEIPGHTTVSRHPSPMGLLMGAARRVLHACIDAAWFVIDLARLRSIARARWVRDYRRAERQERQAPTP